MLATGVASASRASFDLLPITRPRSHQSDRIYLSSPPHSRQDYSTQLHSQYFVPLSPARHSVQPPIHHHSFPVPIARPSWNAFVWPVRSSDGVVIPPIDNGGCPGRDLVVGHGWIGIVVVISLVVSFRVIPACERPHLLPRPRYLGTRSGTAISGTRFFGSLDFPTRRFARTLKNSRQSKQIKTHPSTTDLQAITTNRLGNFCRLALQEASILMDTPKGHIFSPPRPPKRAEATAFSPSRHERRKLPPTKRRNIRGIERTRTTMTRRTTKGSHRHRQTSHLLVC